LKDVPKGIGQIFRFSFFESSPLHPSGRGEREGPELLFGAYENAACVTGKMIFVQEGS